MKKLKIAGFGLLMAACTVMLSYAFSGDLKDGTYEGEYSFVRAEVVISEGKVEDIKMTHHGGGGEKYARMVQLLPAEMIENGTTQVDSVTGATVSSENLKRAVEDAISKASK